MSDSSQNAAAPVPSGLEVRHIQTRVVQRTIDGKTVDVVEPVLDEHGREIVLSSVTVPLAIEAEGAKEIAMHVAETLAYREAKASTPTSSTVPTADEGDES